MRQNANNHASKESNWKTKNCCPTVTQFSSPVPYWIQGSSFSFQCYFIDASSNTLGPHLKSLFQRVVICETALLRSQMERTQFQRLCLDLKLHEMLVVIENSYNYNQNTAIHGRYIHIKHFPYEQCCFFLNLTQLRHYCFYSPGYKGKRYLTKILTNLN